MTEIGDDLGLYVYCVSLGFSQGTNGPTTASFPPCPHRPASCCGTTKCKSAPSPFGPVDADPCPRLLSTVVPPIAVLGYLYAPLFGRRDALKIVWLALMVSP